MDGYKKDIGTCRFCQAMIIWGYRFGKKHPYDIKFDAQGTPQKGSSHLETCRMPKNRFRYQPGLRARGDAHTRTVEAWRRSCAPRREHAPIDWKGVTLLDVPERHSLPIAVKLCEDGGPFSTWHPRDLIEHFREAAVSGSALKAVLVTPAIYNRIHYHIHGFAMSVFGDMSERRPVEVAGYRLEPSLVVRVCTRAHDHTCTEENK